MEEPWLVPLQRTSRVAIRGYNSAITSCKKSWELSVHLLTLGFVKAGRGKGRVSSYASTETTLVAGSTVDSI